MWRQRFKNYDLEPVRYLNLALASWVLISAYLWSHTGTQFMVTITAGAIVAVLAPFEVGSPLVRHINMATGAALAVATVVLPRTSALTLWNNVILGLAIFTLSFFGPPHGIVKPRPEAPADAYEATGGV